MSYVHDTDTSDTFEVGKYIVNRKRIGKGASGIIYKGKHRISGKEVAIKEIHEENLNNIKQTIKTEINVMRKLKHPNIIGFEDVILDHKYNNIYIVMEYCPDGDFYNFQKRQPIQEIHVQKYMKQLMSGLKYLKNFNIIHRDLKPQNILIAKDGTLKLTDFGYAKVVRHDNLTKTFCGSPLYMAPEIIKGKGKEDYTNKSDLWSVGCIFYEMITGFPPYYVNNLSDLLRKINEDNIIIPKSLNISEESKDLLMSLLQPDPNYRISWDDFFNHTWLKKDLLSDEENKLLAFDIGSDDFSSNLPSIELYRQNTKIFVSTHLTDSEQNIFRLNNKNTSNISIHAKSSQDYIVVGTPPERALEKENLKHITKIIQHKIENNIVNDRKLDDIYDDFKESQHLEDDNDMFFSCDSLQHPEDTEQHIINNNIDNNIDDNIDNNIDDNIDNNIDDNIDNNIDDNIDDNIDNNIDDNIDNNISEKIQKELNERHLRQIEKDLADAMQIHYIPETNLENKLIINNSTCDVNHFGSDSFHMKNPLLESSTYESELQDTFDFDKSFDGFSTSLISTGQSLCVENTEAYVIIQQPKHIMQSDQYEYRQKSKIGKLLKKSINIFKGSVDYIGSYGSSI